jgi:hypothetical protein
VFYFQFIHHESAYKHGTGVGKRVGRFGRWCLAILSVFHFFIRFDGNEEVKSGVWDGDLLGGNGAMEREGDELWIMRMKSPTGEEWLKEDLGVYTREGISLNIIYNHITSLFGQCNSTALFRFTDDKAEGGLLDTDSSVMPAIVGSDSPIHHAIMQ